MFPLQQVPVYYSPCDHLYANSRQEAIRLLQSKWGAWIDDNGFILDPMRRFWLKDATTVNPRIPDYEPGSIHRFSFLVPANHPRDLKNGLAWSQTAVTLHYIRPGTNGIWKAPSVDYPSAQEIANSSKRGLLAMHKPGDMIFSSRL